MCILTLAPTSVHGRFQPFHNGHLSYVLCALERTEHLHVGITRLDRKDAISNSNSIRAGLHSEEDRSNPFSFFQRLKLVEAGILSAGIPKERFTILPFPIETPDRLASFFPRSGLCYTTIKDDWNKKKIEVLEREGFKVEVLEHVEQHGFSYASGTQIREWAQHGNPEWLDAVPKGVRDLLNDWDGHPVKPDFLL